MFFYEATEEKKSFLSYKYYGLNLVDGLTWLMSFSDWCIDIKRTYKQYSVARGLNEMIIHNLTEAHR